MCGFYCSSTPQQTQPPSCLFSVVTYSRGPQLKIVPTGDLILHDSDGTFLFGSHLITQLTPYLLARLCFLARSLPPAHPHRIGLQKIPFTSSSSTQFISSEERGVRSKVPGSEAKICWAARPGPHPRANLEWVRVTILCNWAIASKV
ncbi:hypothetical protein HYC85_015161 [Camellia sinensis]|uniref:Uncharacterized protein n=1 Tax=Camellia sinensis TaxID=4442 RepID=A0A7J7HBE9_CAMSI|nr:hypothetical protein HYC85_015161 [Camellia sinensis]